ncbi:HN1_G0054980.mRNA.1.CDS.1 [Saccharomyces cerevisiae]|nr:HN1_G0054980.mRNA.1.CDS.1 [Saccharomyces cerevisiae]
MIVAISLLVKAMISAMQNILVVIHQNIRILKMELKIHYRLSTNNYTINILSYTVLDDDISYEKLSSKLEEAEVQGLIM